MRPRDARIHREAQRFMPRLWSFAYPFHGRSFKRGRRLAFKAWAWAFHVRVRMLDA
jgi:hypothetical protein